MRDLQPSWKKDFRNKDWRYDKSPRFLIISASALRAVELLKHFGSFQCKVAKLFAKHMKIQDQADQLERMFLPIAVGTPGRVKALLEIKALSLEHTRHVIIDMEKDKKSLTVLQLNDTVKDMMDLLQFHFLPRLNQQKLKLVLY
jgi:protein CMS1